ncbi:MAG: hypothetical protein OEQ24_01145 [Gammaproteobacteria bacterium]|nr:hypothetical protein [Gammaproteobacteria bacterium]
MSNLLANIQNNLQLIYEVSVPLNVDDFLITDRYHAEILANTVIHNDSLEQLLISPQDDCLDVSLYLDNELINRLCKNYPSEQSNKDDLHDFWIALEGVSHFLYLAWNANHDRPVSQLELELQAEVDKFVSATAILGLEKNKAFMQEIWSLLFSQPKFNENLEKEHLARYMKANKYASKYCLNLIGMNNKTTKCFHNELRRFYRLNQRAKLSRIDTLNTDLRQ